MRLFLLGSSLSRQFAAVLTLSLIGIGCADTQAPPASSTAGAVAPAPAADAKSQLTLDQIPPSVFMPAARPATQPDAPAPVQSLALYAAARDAMDENQPLGAIGLLQQAIAVDPDSFELYRALGEAQLAALQAPNQAELNSFEKALELRPDDLRLQSLLGSQYAAMGQIDKALLHLRLAVQTPQYRQDSVAAAAVDLLLARLLQDQGYDRAAEDRYLILIHRLENPTFALRTDPELGGLADNPAVLWVQVGALREKHGQWALALMAYQPLADADPSNFELQARVVRMLSNLGRSTEAFDRAAKLVASFDASADSLALLKEVCKERGLDINAEIARLQQANPNDHALLLARADLLSDQGHVAEARKLLESPNLIESADPTLVSKLFSFYMGQNDIKSATRLLIVYLARHPDLVGEIEPWWDELLRDSRPNPLRLVDLQTIDVDKSAQSAKLFLIWRLADLWRRDALARESLEQSVHLMPPFGPAYRQMVLQDWERPDWDEPQKQKASEDLAAAAANGGNVPLSYEVRGLTALADQKPAQAITFFEQALAQGGTSPQLVLTYAAALQDAKQDVKAEQLLWKLVNERPQFDQAWEAFFQFYIKEQNTDQSRKVLSQWLAAIPASVEGRILQADLATQEGDTAAAESILLKVFAEHDDDPDVISALLALGQRTGRVQQFITRLDEIRQHEPHNAAVVEWLVDIYTAQGRTAQAVSVLDETRAAVAKDADELYRIAHLYEKVSQPRTTEDVLQQVVKLDPQNASASNDLGYSWADQGKNLPQAEAMIRLAISQEPDNQSYLDSMGWVLYKQHKYAEAETYMVKAVGPALQPDPVVLDHYGDVLYRLGRHDDAARQWQRALDGLGEQSADREDLKDLHALLERKLAQNKQGDPASVAPVAGET